MKLISCYIENFGGLHRYSLDFSEGLTVVMEPNGFGKTTLAEFLRAMFYGFPRKGKTLEKSKRQKYTPWSGEKSGGNLVFEVDGVTYRLERTFGATPKGDSFSLIDLSTGKKSDRFSEDIGMELFQLDGESFERSTYCPQTREELPLTSAGIQAKLTRLVEDTGDIGNFDKAVKALKEKRSSFIPYRGSGGAVAEAVDRITALQRELDRAEADRDSLAQWGREIEALEEAALRKQQEAARLKTRWEQAAEAAALEQHRQELVRRLRRTEEEREDLNSRYPGGIPGEPELVRLERAADRLAVLESAALTPEEQTLYSRLCRQEEAGLLDGERLGHLEEKNRQLLRQRAVLENLAVAEDDLARQRELGTWFAPGVPDRGEVQSFRQDLEDCARLRREGEREGKQNGLFLAGCVVISLGCVLAVLRQLAGILVLAAGCGMLVAGCLKLRKAKQRKLRREEEISRREQAVEAFTRRYTDAPAAEALEEIRIQLDRLEALETRLARQRERYAAQEEQVCQNQEALCRELGSDDFDKALTELRLAREQLQRLRQQEQTRNGKYREEMETVSALLAAFSLAPAADLRGQLQRIRADGGMLDRLDGEGRQTAEALAQCPEAPAGENTQTLRREAEALDGAYTALREQILKQHQQMQQLRERADRIPELEDGLVRWQQRKEEGLRNARLLDDAVSFLDQARESLTTSYLGPVRSHFAGYLEAVNGVEPGQAFITPELDVRLERQGQARELGYFSAGQADAVMLCMRLALVDALFPETKPFIILDDPFVNLDDAHTAQALDLLETLAARRQIIYLTCNSSRTK